MLGQERLRAFLRGSAAGGLLGSNADVDPSAFLTKLAAREGGVLQRRILITIYYYFFLSLSLSLYIYIYICIYIYIYMRLSRL